MTCPSETRLQAFVDGELSSSEIAELSAHLDACEECRALLGAVQPLGLDGDETADRVGRYVLRRVLGQGGMGVVYEAVDPELHRVVALKILRADLGDAQERLLEEARAMAKLSHPNVVTIHDVGREGRRVFIVMALVPGVTLRSWLAAAPRTADEIFDVFEQAAEGLRAAHDKGLVHRDFKPDNVFVDDEGRALVGDFGLAIPVDAESAEAAGSLAYMAPEQRAGEAIDARADQYAFSVALDEATRELSSAPRWLAKLVARGKARRPEDRFASMDALLSALRAGRGRVRRRTIATIATVVVAIASAAVWYARPRVPQEVTQCHAREAEMSAVWNDGVSGALRQAATNTKSPLADRASQRAVDALGAYAQAWRGAHRRVCEEHRTRDPGARATLDKKRACLGDRLETMRAVTATLEHVDAPMLEQMPAVLQLLPRVASCEDAGELAQAAPLPDADKAAQVEEAKKKIALAAATVAGGRYKEGLATADEAWQLANRVAYLPALAEAYLWVGVAHGRLGHTREAENALSQAASSASAGHALETAVRAWIQLMHFVGFEGKRYEEGVRYSDYAKAALESLPGAVELEVERLSWSRAMLLDQKRYDDALVVSRQELSLVELRLGPSHRLSAAALDGLAGVLVGQCKSRDAIDPQTRACAILEKEYGSPHPQLALCLGNLAALHANLGEHARAMEIKERVAAMFEAVPGHPNHVGMAHRNMVRSLIALDRLQESEAELAKAASLSQREADETAILLLRGELRARARRFPEAIADHTQAVTRTKDAEPSRKLEPLLSLARTELAAARYTDASVQAAQALATARAVYGESSCRLGEPLLVQAEALLGAGRTADALPLAQDALRKLEGAQLDPQLRARADADVERASSRPK